MATTLAHLDADLLGSILDMVDSTSLMRTLIIGNKVLNNKLYRTVRRFEHVMESAKPRTFAPKIISRFSALTHISLSRGYLSGPLQCCVVHGIDVMAFPATLQSLELYFTNSLFCLLESLPTASTRQPYVPRLRQDLKLKFKHLERVSWSQGLHDWMQNWDLLRFAEDCCAFPLVLDPWPYDFPSISLDRAVALPSTTQSLKIEVTDSDTIAKVRLLPTLKHLTVSHHVPITEDFLCNLPSTLEQLRFRNEDNMEDYVIRCSMAPIRRFQLLSSLEINPECCNTDFVRLLPQSLTQVYFGASNLEFESLAHFPANITGLKLHYENVYSSSTGAHLEEFLAYDLTDDFCPNMREVVSKLPRRLRFTNPHVFRLVRPCDWDVLPREQFRGIYGLDLEIETEAGPFIAKLPQTFERVALTAGGATLPLVSGLPIFLRGLSAFLRASALGLSSRPGSTEESEAVLRYNESLFETLSKRTPLLKSLELDIDHSFEFNHMRHLQVPLQSMTISAISLPRIIPKTSRALSQPLACLSSLQILFLQYNTVFLLGDALPSLLRSCPQLTQLTIEDQITNEVLPCLPSSLREIRVPFKMVDADLFRALPRGLNQMDLRPTAFSRYAESQWHLHDLFFLPTQIRSVKLPKPANKPSSEEETKSILRVVADAFPNHVRFDIGPVFEEDTNFVYDSSSIGSMDALINLELFTRSAATPIATSSSHDRSAMEQQNGQEEDFLPEPSQRNKRKVEHDDDRKERQSSFST